GLGTFDGTAGADLAVTAMGAPGDTGAMGKVFFLSGHPYDLNTASGLQALALSELGLRDNNGVPSGNPIDTGMAQYWGFNLVAVGNVYNLPSANRPNTVDLAIFNGYDNSFYVYLGDTDFAKADRLEVGPAAGGTNVYLGESICNGTTRGDLDGDSV